MSAPTTATRRPFTLVVCTGCDVADDSSVIERLRGTVRRCPHGVLVSAGRTVGPRTWVLMQPCWPDRTPVGSAHWIGPVVDRRDAHALCSWVEGGDWDVAALPARLRSAPPDG